MFQLSQIDEHLGDLSKAFDGCGFNGKYRPEFARIAYHIALLYFLAVCRHKYRVTVSNQHRDVLQCRKCSKRVIVRRSKYRNV